MATRTFYIGLSRSRDSKVGSVLLQTYMNTDYSHTFFELDHKHLFGENTIFHATMSSGVSYWSSGNFDKVNIKTHLYKIDMEELAYKTMRGKLHRMAGEHYGFMQNLGILLVDGLRNLGINVRNPFRDHANCSELVFYALVELHPELADKYKPNTIRPDHIHEILEQYGYENVMGGGN